MAAGALFEINEPEAAERDTILRFRRSERHLHWAIAAPFMVCYATATMLVLVYNPHPMRPYHAVFSWIHRISGGCLIVLPPATILAHWRDFRLHVHNVGWVWRWTLADVKWLFLIGPASFSSSVTLPHQGKFNAGEKINFIALMCTYPVYVVTGVLIALPGIAYTSWLIHASTAVLVATPLMLGHIFMALVNPDTRPGLGAVLTGEVARHWAHHHYRIWYERTFVDEPVPSGAIVETPADPAPAPPPAEGEPVPAIASFELDEAMAGGLE